MKSNRLIRAALLASLTGFLLTLPPIDPVVYGNALNLEQDDVPTLKHLSLNS